MKNFLKKLPYPLGGLILAYAALGNLLGTYALMIQYTCGVIAVTLLIGILLKIKEYPGSINEAFQLPPVASVMVTLPMAMILLAGYVRTLAPLTSKFIWVCGIVLYGILMIQFTRKHLLPFKIEKVLVSYFVTYIGIVVVSVTAKGFGEAWLGQGLFYFGLIMYIILLPIVLYKLVRLPQAPEPVRPLTIILAAPANLLLMGYLKSMAEPLVSVVIVLLILGIGFTLFAWLQLPKLLKLPFYPSYSAFTFPLVIGALASRGAYTFLSKQGMTLVLLDGFAFVQMAIAIGLVIYVTIRYIRMK